MTRQSEMLAAARAGWFHRASEVQVGDEGSVLGGLQTNVRNPVRVRERRAALVQAAVDVFAAKGYGTARVADVAKAAGLSQGSVYNYVSSKEDLLYLVTEDHLRGYERIVMRALAEAETPEQKLQALLRGTIEAIFTYRKHYLVMVRELHLVGKERRRGFLKLAAEQRQICEDILKQIAGQRFEDGGQTRLIANILLFLPSIVVARGWDLRGHVSEEEITETLMRFLERGLGFGLSGLLDGDRPAGEG
jgi:AcrR family transcriptional regulator